MKLSVIDPKAGTHFTDMKVAISQHARERAVERFGITPSDVNSQIIDRLKRSSLIDDNFTSDEGKSARLFVYDGTCFIVAQDAPFLLTLYQHKYEIIPDVLSPISNVIKRIIKAAQRVERTELKRLSCERAEINLKIAEVELSIATTTQPARAKVMQRKVNEYETQIKRIDDEINEVKRAKAAVLKSASAYM